MYTELLGVDVKQVEKLMQAGYARAEHMNSQSHYEVIALMRDLAESLIKLGGKGEQYPMPRIRKRLLSEAMAKQCGHAGSPLGIEAAQIEADRIFGAMKEALPVPAHGINR